MGQGSNVFDEIEQERKQAATPAPGGNVFDQIENERKASQPPAAPAAPQQSTWQKLTQPYDPGAEKYGPVGRFFSSVGGAAMASPQGAWKMIAHPEESGEEFGKQVGEAAKAWTKPETWKGAPSVLPEALGTGVGTVAGNEAMGALPGAVKAVPKVAADASKAWTDARTPARIASADKLLTRAQRPGYKDTGYAARQTAAMPDLQEIAHKNPNVASPRDAVDAIDAHIEDMNQPIKDAAKAVQGEPWADKRIDISQPLMDAAQRKFADSPGTFLKEDTAKALETIKKYTEPPTGLGGWSPMEMENLRKTLNDETSAYYKSSTADRLAMNRDAEMAGKKAAADELRDQLYGKDDQPGILETAAGVKGDTRALRQRIGNLVAFRNNMEKAIVRSEQVGPWSLGKEMGTRNPSGIVGSGGIGMGIGAMMGGPWGGLLGGLLGEGMNAWHSYLTSKNPNLNVSRAFGKLENTTPPNLPGVTAPDVPPGLPRTNPATQTELPFMGGSLGETRPTLYKPPVNPPLIQGEQDALPLWPESETKLAPLGETRPSKWKPVKKNK